MGESGHLCLILATRVKAGLMSAPARGAGGVRAAMETIVTDLSEQVCGGGRHAAGETLACRQGHRLTTACRNLRNPQRGLMRSSERCNFQNYLTPFRNYVSPASGGDGLIGHGQRNPRIFTGLQREANRASQGPNVGRETR